MSDATTSPPQAKTSSPAPAAAWKPQSPFVDQFDARVDDLPLATSRRAAGPVQAMESPFLSVYESAFDDEPASPRTAQMYAVLAELRDREFDDVVYQLRAEAYDLFAPRLEGEDEPGEVEVDQFFEVHFGPLVRETHALLDQMVAEMERHDLDALSEPEIDRLLDRFEPRGGHMSPSFEGFLKKIFKKAKRAVKKVAGAVKKGVRKVVKTVGKIASAPVALVLKKLKSLVKPLLSKVLKSAIDKLPEPLQDAARQAAAKLFGEAARTDTPLAQELAVLDAEMQVTLERTDADADEELRHLQTEFDLQIANLVLAEDETQQDLAIAEYEQRARRLGPGHRRRLHRARRRLAKDLKALGDDDDAAPAVENFIPALLPVLKLGLKLIGRKRVVSTLARLIGPLLRPFTGPKMAKPLANAIVGTGLSLVGLETSEEDKADVAASTTAAVVEDTLREVVQMPAEVLEDEILLEAMVEEAFEGALAANMPPMPRRPELVTRELPGSWVSSQGKQYRRFEPPVAVQITQAMANGLTTFGGGAVSVLGHPLRSLVGRNAQVRLYEAVPGTWLSKISRDETDVSGLGGVEEVRWRSIHPLTSANASQLLKDPGMANDAKLDAKFLLDPNRIDVGQRFFYIEVPGLTPGDVLRQDSSFFYVLHCPQRFVSMTLYLSEADAQAVAKALRSQDKAAAGKALAKVLYHVGKSAVTNDIGQSVDIRKELVEIERLAPAAAFAAVLRWALIWMLKQLMKWAAKLLFDKMVAEPFQRVADDPADGLTMKLTWSNPAGLDAVCRLLNGKKLRAEDLKVELRKLLENLLVNIPRPTIEPGYRRD